MEKLCYGKGSEETFIPAKPNKRQAKQLSKAGYKKKTLRFEKLHNIMLKD